MSTVSTSPRVVTCQSSSTNLRRKPHDKPAAYNRPAKQNGEVESDAADDDNTHASITHTNLLQ